MLKFYNREKEIALLVSSEQKSMETAQMTFVTGRRRIGKTSLLANVFKNKTALYFFVEKKNEALLCEEFTEEIQNKLGVIVYGEMRTFKNVFSRDCGNYFSILMLIASSKTSRSEMESIMNISLGGFLDKFENEFGLITKQRPVLSKPAGKNVKYRINDNFLNFWFRFIFKYRGAIEMGNFDYVKAIIQRDYPTYSGQILERYFREKITNEEPLSAIGSYWESGNQNEIDIVALNEYEKTAIIAEVERTSANINLNALQNKAANLVKQLSGYHIEYRALSMNDM